MKITIKEKVGKQTPKIKLADLKPGTVFEYEDGAVGLKGVEMGEIFLLTYSDSDRTNWLTIADGYKTEPIKKVLGTIEEVIVSPL